ncbi:DUF4192 family protein [Kineococcus sp. LSe6-4]|uniref:DUF4192 family protein n=1 Tax=Kineococcus halophytocola TaxID=3234027 RepID=A0ABV4GWW0_9ACTN
MTAARPDRSTPTGPSTGPSTGGAGPLVATGVADLLALLPYRLGFHPADSLVLLELLAPAPGTRNRRLGLVVRADLPPAPGADGTATAAAAEATAGQCLRLVRRQARAGSELLVVLYDPEARSTGGQLRPGPRAAAVLEAVRTGLGALGGVGGVGGVEPAEHVLVGAGRWRTLTCSGPCCPAGGAPWPPRGSGRGPERGGDPLRLQAEAVWRGFFAAPDRAASLSDLAPVDPARCAAAAAASRAPVTPARSRALVEDFGRAVDQGCVGPVPVLPAAWCGHLLRALERLPVRDAVLAAGSGGSTDPTEPLDAHRAAVAADVALQVARHAGPGGAAAWAVVAWLEWAAGRSVRAGACARRSLRADPGHRLALLVEQAVRHGLGPGGWGAGGGPGGA